MAAAAMPTAAAIRAARWRRRRATVPAGGCRRTRACRRLAALVEQCLTAEADLAGRVDVDDLHQHLLAFLQLVAHVLHAVFRDLGHVEEAVHPRHDLDERA